MKRRTSLDQIRENLRLQQVYNVFWRYGMDILIDRGVMGDFRRFMQEKLHDPPQPLIPLSVPVRVRLMLQELGPTYVKMGQMVSSRSEILPQEWEAELVKLQSNVPPFPLDQVRQIISQELGAPPEELFAVFEPEPLAAASTAQVHRATLPAGPEVVVKVQRPHITSQVKADLGIMRNGVRVLQRRAEWAKDLDLLGILNEFGDNIIAELDYTGEAYNARRMALNMAGLPGIHIPVIYTKYSTSKVLTMEFVKGVKVNNRPALEQAGLSPQGIGENFTRGFLKQLLIDGFFHADPHPGNVLVNLEEGTINFIDIGMVGELDLMQRVNLISLMMVMYQGDARGLAQVIKSLSTPFKEVDEKAFFRDFERRLSRYFGLEEDAPFAEVMGTAFDILLDHGLRLDPQLTLGVKALIQLEAVTRVLMPETKIVVLAYAISQELVFEHVSVENIADATTKEVILILREILQLLPNAREGIVKWIDQYLNGQFSLRLDTSELNQELKAMQTVSKQIILGLMLVGMIIGSAIATGISSAAGDMWSLLPRVAFIGYIFSMLVAGVMVISLIWQLWRRSERE